QVPEAGNYSLWNAGEQVKGLSFNYDRRESVPEVLSPSELESMLLDAGLSNIQVVETTEAGLGQALEQARLGLQLWKLFLILALACLLAEVLLLRFWR
ncbi:MAG: hypothetical protein K0B09_12475, partial [Bacteroidales bacterium]|nr:hypothetical protein [Bacteroidales bacterium]